MCTLETFVGDLCLNQIDGSSFGLALEVGLLGYAFAGLAMAADHLCNSMETLCDHWKVPEDVGGATFMAFGAAVPEITVNAISTLRTVLSTRDSEDPSDEGQARDCELGIGAICGSGLIAFLVIPSICTLAAPAPLSLKRRPLLRDMTAYLTALLVLLHVLLQGEATLPSAVALVLCYFIYVAVLVLGRPVRNWARRRRGQVRTTTTSVFRDRYENASFSQATSFHEPPLPAPERRSEIVEMQEGPVDSVPVPASTEGAGGNAALLRVGVLLTTELPLDRRCPLTFLRIVGQGLLKPLAFATDATCPDCRITMRWEKLYMVTFFASLTWICVFSFLVTVVCDRWVALLEQPNAMGFLGLAIVAIGAEVPDTAQAVAVARRGYGSMATASCMGSQVVNICIGLGMPWLITASLGKTVDLQAAPVFLRAAAWTLLGSVLGVAVLLLGVTLVARQPKSKHSRWKAFLCLGAYAVVLTCLGYLGFLGRSGVSAAYQRAELSVQLVFPSAVFS